MPAAGEVLLEYSIGDWRLSDEDSALVEVSFKTQFASDGRLAKGVRDQWRVERVDGLWKVGRLPRQQG
ncbi:MAG: hypothetical protein ACYC5Q_02540 [Thermoleophilia bacterium]